jgi:hypothetical protein
VRTGRVDGNHRYSWTKNQRSLLMTRFRPGTLRRKTINWCRSAAFSASSRLFDLNGEANTAKTKQSSANIVCTDVR